MDFLSWETISPMLQGSIRIFILLGFSSVMGSRQVLNSFDYLLFLCFFWFTIRKARRAHQVNWNHILWGWGLRQLLLKERLMNMVGILYADGFRWICINYTSIDVFFFLVTCFSFSCLNVQYISICAHTNKMYLINLFGSPLHALGNWFF